MAVTNAICSCVRNCANEQNVRCYMPFLMAIQGYKAMHKERKHSHAATAGLRGMRSRAIQVLASKQGARTRPGHVRGTSDFNLSWFPRRSGLASTQFLSTRFQQTVQIVAYSRICWGFRDVLIATDFNLSWFPRRSGLASTQFLSTRFQQTVQIVAYSRICWGFRDVLFKIQLRTAASFKYSNLGLKLK
jgi:hypothetical protein